MAVPPQDPAVHTSPTVQRSPSSQVAPFGFAGFEHAPVAGSQLPAAWQASSGAQATPAQRFGACPPDPDPQPKGKRHAASAAATTNAEPMRLVIGAPLFLSECGEPR
jgi:hypothetical protein